jgi:hypothetical protein
MGRLFMAKQYRPTKKCGPARRAAKQKLAEDEKNFKLIRRLVARTGLPGTGQSAN